MSTDYEELKKSFITEHNRLRADPKSYIPILEEHISYFKGDILYRPNEIPLQTNEGATAYEEAISFLKKQRPVPTLTCDERLEQAAVDHMNDIGSKGILSHEGSDGKSVSDRIERYCEWEVACCENIDLGAKKGTDAIISLLVDDGISNRSHRLNLFKSEFKFIGVAVGIHKEYDTIIVIDYVGGIRELGKPFHDYKNYKYQYPKNLNLGFQLTEQVEKKPKTSFQLEDEDAPDDTQSVKIMKATKIYDGRKHKVTKKFYTLIDGTQHIVEVEEI